MTLMVGVMVLIPALALTTAAAIHAVSPGLTRRAVQVHGLLGPAPAAAVSVLLPIAEVALGASAVLAFVGGASDVLAALLTLQGVLFVAFTAYLVAVHRHSDDALSECGCGAFEMPVGRPAIARAATFSVVALLASLVIRTEMGKAPTTTREIAVAFAISLVLSLQLMAVFQARSTGNTVRTAIGVTR